MFIQGAVLFKLLLLGRDHFDGQLKLKRVSLISLEFDSDSYQVNVSD